MFRGCDCSAYDAAVAGRRDDAPSCRYCAHDDVSHREYGPCVAVTAVPGGSSFGGGPMCAQCNVRQRFTEPGGCAAGIGVGARARVCVCVCVHACGVID